MLGDNEPNGPPGRRIVLASCFAGGPRRMIAQYQDAMTIVSKYEKPNLFLTSTCNPNWPEITSHLSAKLTASDGPDVVARVFNLKIKDLCDELFKKKVFGEVADYIYVIEFQKCRLSHMHMLITLKHEYKLTTAAAVDCLISTELPDVNIHPSLFEIVSKTMIHRPCGSINPSSPCMRDGVCTKRYPKNYRCDTSLSVDGYPEYKSRNDGRFFMCRGIAMEYRFVVPYSPYLTKLFQAHINVEVCALLHVIKYVLKYIYKGSDHARIRFARHGSEEETAEDEISTYMDAIRLCPGSHA